MALFGTRIRPSRGWSLDAPLTGRDRGLASDTSTSSTTWKRSHLFATLLQEHFTSTGTRVAPISEGRALFAKTSCLEPLKESCSSDFLCEPSTAVLVVPCSATLGTLPLKALYLINYPLRDELDLACRKRQRCCGRVIHFLYLLTTLWQNDWHVY